MNILALDVGTSSVKAAVLEVETGEPLGLIGREHYPLDSSTPEAAEVPAARLWQAITEAARQVTRFCPEVHGIGLSVLTPALVLLGKDDLPLEPIWTHLDRRARPAARQVWAAVGEEFLATVGNRPLPGGITAVCFRQMLVLDPYLAHRVRSYLHVNGWLGLVLTGEKAFDPGNASFTGLFSTMTDRRWSPRWCDFFEVDAAWLPPVRDGNTTLGTLRSGPAAELGVPPGIPVKLGLPDTSSAMLAVGLEKGDLLHEVGTTQVVAVLTEKPKPAPQRLTRLLGIGDRYLQVSHNPVGGVAFEWLRHLCFRDQSEAEFFGPTIAQARERKTRVTLDPPFLGGDRQEIEAHRAAFRDLELTTDRMDLLAALLEALVRQHRKALDHLGHGNRFRRIFLSGGAAELIHQLIPEYQDQQVQFVSEGSLRGVAKLFGG